MNFRLLGKTAAVVLAAGALVLGAVAPAQAATSESSPLPAASPAVPGEVTYAPGVDAKNPSAVKLAKDLAAKGGGVIAQTYTVAFQPVAPAGAKSTPAAEAVPSGCEVHGTLGYTHRTTTRSSLYHYADTWCPAATSGIEMTLTTIKEDTVWGTLSTVSNQHFTGHAPQLNVETDYRCPTNNVSGFKGRVMGYLWIGSTQYVAPYETAGFARYNCG